MSSNAVKLSDNNEVESRPQLTVISTQSISDEVYRRYLEHFSALHVSVVSAAVKPAFRNYNRKDYRRNAETPLNHRIRIVADIAPLVSQRWLEWLADFILSEDMANGVMLTDRFRDETDEKCLEFPPLGGAAIAYQEMEMMNLLTPELLKHRKVCESCLSYFIDTSPAKNAKRCGPRCTRWAENLRIRRHRNNGEDRLLRDRERQQLEYPFYSPYELAHIGKYTEQIHSEDSIDRKVQSKKRGGRKKPQQITMDSNKVSTHFKPYNPPKKGESGPVETKQRRPEVIERYIRMKYGEIRPYTPYI